MNNENLINYLKQCVDDIENFPNPDHASKIQDYFYFANLSERLSMHVVENEMKYGNRGIYHCTQIQKNQLDILSFRPWFDTWLTQAKILEISDCVVPETMEDVVTDETIDRFLNQLAAIENKRGILNALLTLRQWAFIPTADKGAKTRQRLSISYLKAILKKLSKMRPAPDATILAFLKWCGKKTIKVTPWGFEEHELRSPPPSALPIYIDEAIDYLLHFQHQSCAITNLKQDHAEMVVYLSLCFACTRHWSNYFQPNDILAVDPATIRDVPAIVKIPYQPCIPDIIQDSKSLKGKNAHRALLMGVSPEFLEDEILWPTVLPECKFLDLRHNLACKFVTVSNRKVLISKKLAEAITIMGKFSLSLKDVENRLSEAFKQVGLTQSTGGISPRCFLFHPHFWKGVNMRKNYELNGKTKIIKNL